MRPDALDLKGAKMKNMYTYGSQPTQRLLTIKDLQDNKGIQKYTMVTAVNRAEAEACAAAGIHTISCDYDDYDEVRAGAPNTLIITALPPTQFTTNDDILRAGFSAMERGSDGLYTCRGRRTIEMLAHEGFAVMSHIGVLPPFDTLWRNESPRQDDAERTGGSGAVSPVRRCRGRCG